VFAADLFRNLGELTDLQFTKSGLMEQPVAAVKDLKKLKNLYLSFE